MNKKLEDVLVDGLCCAAAALTVGLIGVFGCLICIYGFLFILGFGISIDWSHHLFVFILFAQQ